MIASTQTCAAISWHGSVDAIAFSRRSRQHRRLECAALPKAMEQASAQMAAQMQRQQQAERAKLSPAERAKRDKAEADLKK